MRKFLIIILASLLSGTLFAAPKQESDGLLKFATEATYQPFESFTSSGKLEGLDIDLIHALCEKMQRKCEILNQPWDSLIAGLNLGRFDAIFGAMSITAEREKQVAFTQAYYTNQVRFVAHKDAKFNTTVEGLKDKTIGVQTGNTMQYYLRDVYGNNITIKHYPSIQQALLDLQAGRIDAVLSDAPVIAVWLKHKDHDKHFAFLGAALDSKTAKKYFGQGNGIAVSKKNPVLLQQLNDALTELKKSGQLQAIIDKYLH